MSTSLIRTLDHVAAVLRRIGLGRFTRAARRALEGVLQEGIAVEADGVRMRGGIRDRAITPGAIEPLDEERGADGELQLCNLYCRRKTVPGR